MCLQLPANPWHLPPAKFCLHQLAKFCLHQLAHLLWYTWMPMLKHYMVECKMLLDQPIPCQTLILFLSHMHRHQLGLFLNHVHLPLFYLLLVATQIIYMRCNLKRL